MFAYSDAPISSLDAHESVTFDAGRLVGLTPNMFKELMKLTFIGDEKHMVNPLLMRTKSPERRIDSKTAKCVEEAEKMRLEKCLDDDIARVLGAEEGEFELIDHNADKRAGGATRDNNAPLAHDECMAEVSEISIPAITTDRDHSQMRLVAQQIAEDIDCEVVDEDVRGEDAGVLPLVSDILESSVASATAQSTGGQGHQDRSNSHDYDDDEDDTSSMCSCERRGREEEEKEIGKEKEKMEARDRKTHESEQDRSPLSEPCGTKFVISMTDLELIQIASLQVSALKSLTVLLTSNHYMELLLIPKSELTTEKDDDEEALSTDDEIREVMRTVMKQMVQRAVMSTPIMRVVSLAELERAHSMIYQVTVNTLAQDGSNITAKLGKGTFIINLCRNRKRTH